MNREVILKIILENPTPCVDYGLQESKGADFETIKTKRGNGENLEFEFSVRVKIADDNIPYSWDLMLKDR